MEIEALRVRVSEIALNALLIDMLPEDHPLENLRVQLTPPTLIVRGVYPLFVDVPFESLWEVTVRDGKVAARLARFKATGLALSGAQGMILKMLTGPDTRGWLEVTGDTVLIDLDALLAKQGIQMRTNLTAVSIQGNSLVLEAGR